MRVGAVDNASSGVNFILHLHAGMKRDDYILSGHHFWVHFWCGLIFGACLGARVSGDLFDSRRAFISATAAIALVVALCCGYWGDSAWEKIMQFW
jgi:hypothetical protein